MLTALRWADRALEALIVAALAAMVMLVFGNVVLRYGFNSGISLSDELSRFLFVWMTFLGAVLALWRSEHIRAEFLRARLGGRARRVLDVASEGVVALCCGLLIDGAWRFTVLNLTNLAPISKLPLAVVYGSGVVAGVLLLAITLARLWQLFTLPVGVEPAFPTTAPHRVVID